MKYPSEFPKFAIGIPTLNRWDLLRVHLNSYLQTYFPNIKIFVLDNGNQNIDIEHPNLVIIRNKENVGVAASWNQLCQLIFIKHEFAAILNDDIGWGMNEYRIGNFLHYQKAMLFKSLKDWCVFIMPKTTFEKIGPFDETFKAYYEDSDYTYRMKLVGFKPVAWDVLNPTTYRDNGTGEIDPTIYNFSNIGRKYYVTKWGGMPGMETFKTPFNTAKK